VIKSGVVVVVEEGEGGREGRTTTNNQVTAAIPYHSVFEPEKKLPIKKIAIESANIN
jgi:hypothetical protein